MSYITGAIYPSSDRPQLGATEEETLRAYADENTAVALGYANPDIHELHALQKTFNLHELAIEDATRGHQRAKLERYGDSLFAVIRPAIYLDKEEEVRLSELHLFTGPRYTRELVRRTAHQRQVQPALRHPRCIPRPTAAPHPRQHCRQVRPRARGTRERQRRD